MPTEIKVGIKKLVEPWAELELEDGTIIRMRIIIGDVRRILDVYSGTQPGYAIDNQLVMDVKAPVHLQKKT